LGLQHAKGKIAKTQSLGDTKINFDDNKTWMIKPEKQAAYAKDGGIVSDPAREVFLTLPLGRLIFRNTLPAVASMLFLTFYHVMDAILVGRSLGPDALASVNILYPIMALFIGIAVMLGVGGNARLAVFLGAGNTGEARRTLGLIIALGALLGIFGTILVLFGYPVILRLLMGTSVELADMAGEYILTLCPFFIPMILLFILEQSVRNDGHPNMATALMASGAILNIILDYIFLFPLNMGIGGAALATGISQSLGALVFMGYFISKTLCRKPGLRFGIPGGGWPAIRAISFNGSSELFNNVAAGVTTFLFNRALLNYVGVTGVAAFALVQYMLLLGIMIIIGISNGSQPVLSYNHGAGKKSRVRGTLIRVMAASIGVGALFFILLRWQAVPMATMFIPAHPEALEMTLRATGIISWSMFFLPVGIIMSMFFTALEEAGRSLMVAASRGLLFTLMGLSVFPLLWGEFGIWFTLVFAEAATVLIAALLIYQWSLQKTASREE